MSGKIQNLLQHAEADSEHSSVSSAKRQFPDGETAQRFFSILKTRLFNVDEWNEHSTISSFELFDENGYASESKTFFKGVFIRISLKGSGKYDWVKFTDLYESADEIIITVKPTFDPTADPPDKSSTSHFFTAESTNNFCLLSDDLSISLYVIGLNEKQNTTETSNKLEMIRNVATANLGSYLGIQNAEWESFCKSFLDSAN